MSYFSIDSKKNLNSQINSKSLKIDINNDNKKDYQEISLLTDPLKVIFTLSKILFNNVLVLTKYLVLPSTLSIISIILILEFIPNYFSDKVNLFNQVFYTCLYWLILGIASSIGMGTGLHTFVLYLAPHIAKVTMAANECSYFPEMNPSRWNFIDFKPCKTVKDKDNFNSILSIFLNVQIEAFMWGLGTAIGELPPYFMALGASKSGKSNEELQELEEIEKKQVLTIMERLKIFLYDHLQKHGFITVLLCASVSNNNFIDSKSSI